MSYAEIDRKVLQRFESQHGVIARRQLSELGASKAWVRARTDRGSFEWVTPRVLRLVGAPASRARRLMTAALHAPQPAAVSHWSAADHWGLPGWGRHRVDVTTPGRTGYRDEATMIVVHQPRLLLGRHVTERHGTPVTSPTRTIFDLAGEARVHPLRLERALDTAMARSLVSSASLLAMLADLASKGRPGITLMRELVGARSGDEYRPPESGLESRFRQLAASSGLPDFVRQVNVGTEVAWVGRVDFRHPDLPIIVEVDSAAHHGSPTDRAHDERRRTRLAAAGWQVLSVTDLELFHHADQVVARLRRALQAARLAA